MQRELRDGLILRTLSEGYATDRERLPTFYKETFMEAGDSDAATLDIWINDLIERHPHMSLEDFFLVVDPAADDKIVSATLLIPQVWRYEEIELPMGRPEVVATDKAYRRRGLVRALFEEVHARSASLGHLIQGITGIPYYYRQFGYTMAVDLGSAATVPTTSLVAVAESNYTLRSATEADIPNLLAMETAAGRQALLSAVWDEALWRYDLMQRSPGTAVTNTKYMITNADGETVGYISLAPSGDNPKIQYCNRYVLNDEASYLATFNDVLRGIVGIGEAASNHIQLIAFGSNISPELETLLRHVSGSHVRSQRYAWYLRLPDQVEFFRKIAPVLERRLRGSVAHRYSGPFNVGFHNFQHLAMTFEDGKLVDVTLEESDSDAPLHVQFPYEMWLSVVFGHRTRSEIAYILPDAGAKQLGAVLCDALFPKRPHSIMEIA